jgi:hypothetical protein
VSGESLGYVLTAAIAFGIAYIVTNLLARLIVWASYDPSHTGQPPAARFVDMSGRMPPEGRSRSDPPE